MKFISSLQKTLEALVVISTLAAPDLKKEYQQKEETHVQQMYGQGEIYPSEIQMIDGKQVVDRNKYQMGENILGLCWTYSGLIAILEGLKGRDREKVLEHELGHRENPMRSEEENRRKTYTEEPNIHPMVSYLG